MTEDIGNSNGSKDEGIKEAGTTKSVNGDAKNPVIKKSREKSVKYPYYSLKECFNYLSIVHKIGGRKGAQIGSILSEMNINSANNRRFSYLTSSSEIFGLIERSDQLIKPTELGILILFPPNGDSQKKQLLIQSFENSEVYSNIVTKYNETILPNRDLLRIEFYHLKIATNVLDIAVDSFIESAQYVGVLDENSRLLIPTNVPELEDLLGQGKPSPENSPPEPNGQKIPKVAKENPPKENPSDEKDDFEGKIDMVRFEVLTSTGLKAIVCMPSKCSKEDIEKIKKIVNAYGPD
ncbi:MAG: hypothetical protein ACLQMU_01375 [Methanoregula sp.]|uniref:hypothetical protein n=1 Tax=Methanoregula sp. TaxID=2052170 RepID=UPI003FD7636C